MPGMGLRFRTPTRTLEFVICLECKHLNGYEGATETQWSLSDSGVSRLMNVYKANTRN
jgi:hypothetical protein